MRVPERDPPAARAPARESGNGVPPEPRVEQEVDHHDPAHLEGFDGAPLPGRQTGGEDRRVALQDADRKSDNTTPGARRLRVVAALVRDDHAEAAPGDIAHDARQPHALAEAVGQLARQPVVAAHDLVVSIDVGIPGRLVLHGGAKADLGRLRRPGERMLGDGVLLLGAELQVIEKLLERPVVAAIRMVGARQPGLDLLLSGRIGLLEAGRLRPGPGDPVREGPSLDPELAHQFPGRRPRPVDHLRPDLETVRRLLVERLDPATDPVARLQHQNVQPGLRQLPCRGQAGHAGADHDDIVGLLNERPAPLQRDPGAGQGGCLDEVSTRETALGSGRLHEPGSLAQLEPLQQAGIAPVIPRVARKQKRRPQTRAPSRGSVSVPA